MNELIRQIEAAIDANLYLLALTSALALPDICGAVDAANGQATGANYRAWYNEFIAPNYQWLTADECYAFRCKYLHQGQSGPKNPAASAFSQIVFVEPKPAQTGGLNIGKMTIDGDPGPKVIHIYDFVRSVVSGVRKWMDARKDSEPFETNIKNCIDKHPEGMGKTIVGAPVIW